MSFEGIVDIFNVLNTWNLTNYGTNFYGATYLRPANSTNIFYQPRQVQLGFRITVLRTGRRRQGLSRRGRATPTCLSLVFVQRPALGSIPCAGHRLGTALPRRSWRRHSFP